MIEYTSHCWGCDAPVVLDEPGVALCDDPQCRAEWDAVRAGRQPQVCSGCHRPGADCPPRENPEACPHCGSMNPDTRTHYHPYRSTND